MLRASLDKSSSFTQAVYTLPKQQLIQRKILYFQIVRTQPWSIRSLIYKNWDEPFPNWGIVNTRVRMVWCVCVWCVWWDHNHLYLRTPFKLAVKLRINRSLTFGDIFHDSKHPTILTKTSKCVPYEWKIYILLLLLSCSPTKTTWMACRFRILYWLRYVSLKLYILNLSSGINSITQRMTMLVTQNSVQINVIKHELLFLGLLLIIFNWIILSSCSFCNKWCFHRFPGSKKFNQSLYFMQLTTD